jgi:Active DUF488-N3 subclade
MGLGRTTRFAPLPAGARRVSVMRRGTAGLTVLAPSESLLADFVAKKRALVQAGRDPDAAHADACRLIDYRARFKREIRSSREAMAALRGLVAEAAGRDLYLMCMCPYRTSESACHTYLLLELAREIDPTVTLVPEPAPRPRVSRRDPSSGPARGSPGTSRGRPASPARPSDAPAPGSGRGAARPARRGRATRGTPRAPRR